MRGRDGNVHRGNPKTGYLPMISHLGAMISVVNGTLFAKRMKGLTGFVGAACIGDGATSTGSFHEALNQAAIEKLVANAKMKPTDWHAIARFVAALRTGSGEAVQSLFPVFFVFLFLSSMSLPRNLIQTDWFRHVATYNPVSYLLEGFRSLLIKGWDGEALGLAFGIAAAVAVVGLMAASAALRTRLVRT